MMETAIAVFMGSGLGAVARWQLQLHLGGSSAQWPWGTLAANIIGGFFAGIIVAFSDRLPPVAYPLLMTGILGGLTTFSAFTVEVVGMLQRGDISNAGIYLALSLGLSFGSCIAGQAAGRLVI